jgi:hypothetical protein
MIFEFIQHTIDVSICSAILQIAHCPCILLSRAANLEEYLCKRDLLGKAGFLAEQCRRALFTSGIVSVLN